MTQLSFFQPTSWTVTELTHYLRRILEGDERLKDTWVTGEISNLSTPASGHVYFTLKDGGAALRCVMWRKTAQQQEYLPREGDAVEVFGGIGVYETTGVYQFYVDLIRPTGEGRLFQEFLRLKARLEAEGLFALERKRPIPRWPKCIGIVTSPTGAALRDMLNTLRRRFPLALVVLAPTPVQGADAPAQIAAALESICRVCTPDVILLARGGGSIEDLWAFNDERVARAICAALAPVITGVGHETDFTIADFAADLRAPTPTAAAELAAPNMADLQADLEDESLRLAQAVRSMLLGPKSDLSDLTRRLQLTSPQRRLRIDRQRLDDLDRRQSSALGHSIELKQAHLNGLQQKLAALNPLAVLGRGYAVVRGPAGQVVYTGSQVEPGDLVNVRVSEGEFDARVEPPPHGRKK